LQIQFVYRTTAEYRQGVFVTMYAEKIILLSQKLVMLSLADDDKDKKRLKEEIAALNSELSEGEQKTVCCGFLKFTKKEISKMPTKFRKEFRIDGCSAHVRKRCDERYRCSYEIRYRRNGYNITASAKTLEEAKKKFIEKLRQADRGEQSQGKVPTSFDGFARFWFDNFHKRNVNEFNFEKNVRLYETVILPKIGKTPIKAINAKDIQDVLDGYTAAQKFRTAESIFSLFNQILKAAVKFNLIAFNPAEMVYHKKHKRKHGKALTIAEEKILLSSVAGTKFETMFAIALYTGLRPNEYKSVQIDGQMIIARNSKRKNGEIAYKRIPILKMLKPYLENADKIEWANYETIREKFKEILPNHLLYDLRTTFYTRCEMFGVAPSARDEMVGHSSGVLNETYTDLPDEFLIEEAKKLEW
ncbi:MAG: hypothetical protein NC350_05205, partial [Corallococcus sp.]|nr:hypothetical protein [Corallococcus sp.]